MLQLFIDLQRDFTAVYGRGSMSRLWLLVLPDLAASALREHWSEFRRYGMKYLASTPDDIRPRQIALIVGAILVAASTLGKSAVLDRSGPVWLAIAMMLAANLIAALLIELTFERKGALLLAIGIAAAGILLPLFWVANPAEWVRENPLSTSVVLLIAAMYQERPHGRQALLGVAFLLAVAHIGISFL
jgi:hypothetical protein